MMVDVESRSLLAGRKGLVVGMANEHSIAYGCARMFRDCGAELAVTWINEKTRGYVEPLRANSLRRSRCRSMSTSPAKWKRCSTRSVAAGGLDFLLHSIAFAAPQDLHGRVADTSRDGFARAMDISCHSFIRMARLAEPLMDNGGTLLTMTYLGANQVVPNYGVMGPVKAALEADGALSGDRVWAARDSRPRGFSGTDQDACGVWHSGIRRAVRAGASPRTADPRGRDR